MVTFSEMINTPPTFKPGDKVRCIDSGSSTLIKTGEIYKVYRVSGNGSFIYLDGFRAWDGDWYPEMFELVKEEPEKAPEEHAGYSASYYRLPSHATELHHLISACGMSKARGDIFKACYRLGNKEGTDVMYDLQKIRRHAQDLIEMYERGEHL